MSHPVESYSLANRPNSKNNSFAAIKLSLITFFSISLLHLIVSIICLNAYSFKDAKITAPEEAHESIDFPYLVQGSGESNQYTFEAVLTTGFLSPSVFNIVPDDRVVALYVNDQNVDLTMVDDSARQNVQSGFDVNLGEYLTNGDNRIEIIIEDFGGQVGLNLRASPWSATFILIAFGWLIILLGLLVWVAKRSKTVLHWKFAYVLIGVFNVLQIWVIFEYNPVDHIWSDAARHWEQGVDVLRQDLMAFTDPVLFQMYIALLAKVTLKIPALVAYFTSILALLTSFAWYRFFRELQPSKTAALWGCVVISALPSWMAIYNYFMQETLMLPLLGLALWATWRCRRKATSASFVLMVFLWILAGLTRGICIPFAAICCTWLWLYQTEKFKKAGLSLLVLALIMGPLIYRSYQTVGHFAPHGMGHLNVIYAKSGKQQIQIKSYYRGGGWQHGFVSPSMGMTPLAPLSQWQTQREGVVYASVDLAKGSSDWQEEKDEIELSFNDYLWITKENFIYAFFAQSWPDNNLERTADNLSALMRWIWFPLLIISIVLIFLHRKKMAGQWMLPCLIVSWIIVQIMLPISVNEGRYRKPFEGLIIAQLVLLAGVIRRRPTRHTIATDYARRGIVTHSSDLSSNR